MLHREVNSRIPGYMPLAAYVCPAAEAVKNRSITGRAFLDFPVNQTVIRPNYRRNPQELETISNTINVVKEDPTTTISKITIHGYASPEGSYASNSRLAEGRAKALKSYVSQLYKFDNNIFTVNSTPEDWDGLKKAVESSNIDNKEELLSIIASNEEPDAKEARIKQSFGQAYNIMLADIYPALRHSDYTVDYVVRAFTVDEAKAIFKKSPKNLSVEEMYRIAQTHEPGSREFNEVFETAVLLFPNDPSTNLNAAAIAIGKGDYKAAQNYLQKADGTLPETVNNKAIVEYFIGNKKLAKAQFEAAAEKGNDIASQNLKNIKF